MIVGEDEALVEVNRRQEVYQCGTFLFEHLLRQRTERQLFVVLVHTCDQRAKTTNTYHDETSCDVVYSLRL